MNIFIQTSNILGLYRSTWLENPSIYPRNQILGIVNNPEKAPYVDLSRFSNPKLRNPKTPKSKTQ